MWKVDVKGIKELELEFDKIVNEMKDELQMGTQDAANKASEIIAGNAPGSISNAVETKPLPRKEGYPEATMVGVNYIKAPHQNLVEFGTGPRYTAEGAYRGQMPADGFFRRSIDQSEGMIKNTIRNHAQDPINRR